MTVSTRYLPRILASLMAAWLVLAACTGYNPPTPYAPPVEPSPTPARTRRNASVPVVVTETSTPVPLETQPPQAEPTPLPSPTLPPPSPIPPTQNSEPVLGEAQTVPDGGFAFQPVVGFDVNILPGQATLVSKDGRFIFSLAGGRSLSGTPLDSILERLLDNVSKEMDAFQAGEPYPINIGESFGLAADVVGKLSNAPITGEVAVVAPNATQVFYVLAFAVNPADRNLWEETGQETFLAVISSVSFFDPAD